MTDFAYSEELVHEVSKYLPVTVAESQIKSKWKKFSKQNTAAPQRIGDFVYDRVIGKGRQGEVRLAWKNKSPYSIKLIPLANVTRDTIKALGKELRFLDQHHHPHIICIQEAVIDSRYLGLVMEWARGGDLFHFIRLNGAIRREDQSRRWFAELTSAVDFLHTQSFVHHDIKPENILINKNGSVILTDFEMGECFKRQGFPFVNTSCGSLTYCAPEVMLSDAPYNACKADVWAMGVTLYAMVVGQLPFNDHLFCGTTPEEISRQYRNICTAELIFPDSISSTLQHLIGGMLDRNPTSRMSLPDIKRHPWLKSYTYLWDTPSLAPPGRSAGSLISAESQQTISSSINTFDLHDPEQSKQIRGPIIWDPEACGRYWQAPVLPQVNPLRLW